MQNLEFVIFIYAFRFARTELPRDAAGLHWRLSLSWDKNQLTNNEVFEHLISRWHWWFDWPRLRITWTIPSAFTSCVGVW